MAVGYAQLPWAGEQSSSNVPWTVLYLWVATCKPAIYSLIAFVPKRSSKILANLIKGDSFIKSIEPCYQTIL